MAYGTVNADVIQSSVANTSLGAGNASIMKNRIINGAMTVFQRGTSIAPIAGGAYTLDRWLTYASSGTAAVTQSTDAPAGFSNSFLWTQSSAGTRNSGDYFEFVQKIEGYNIADLNQGTANAKTFTISFWVKSSVTGTYTVAIRNGSATYQNYVTTYAVSSANTWEQKSVTIAGSTTGGWLTTNGSGLEVWFDLGTGTSNQTSTLNSWISGNAPALVANTQVGFAQTAGATFYITGVQLEVGSSATGFEYRQYGTELALCQRYYAKMTATSNYTSFGIGIFGATTSAAIHFKYPVTMRSSPTVSQSNCGLNDNTASYPITALSVLFGGSDTCLQAFSIASGGVVKAPSFICANNTTSAYVDFTAEL